MMERLLTIYGQFLGLLVIRSLPYPQDKQKHFWAGALQVHFFGWIMGGILLLILGWLFPDVEPQVRILGLICTAFVGFIISCSLGSWKERYDATQPKRHTVDPNDITATDWGAFIGLVSMVVIVVLQGG